jgi:hypothetical protein
MMLLPRYWIMTAMFFLLAIQNATAKSRMTLMFVKVY